MRAWVLAVFSVCGCSSISSRIFKKSVARHNIGLSRGWGSGKIGFLSYRPFFGGKPVLRVASLLVLCFSTSLCFAQSASVGVTVKMDSVILPGPELEVRPIDSKKTPVILRITATYPHGNDFRYDFEWYGLDPGEYDLKDFLQRKDGKTLGTLPPTPLKVTAIRPPGQIEPNALVLAESPRIGGYRWLLIGLIVAWSLGLLGIVLSFFFPRHRRDEGPTEKPVSLADKLSPLVEGAMRGELSANQLASLERGLFAYWRKRLRLDATDPAEAMNRLRTDSDAGPLLNQLENWLHRPGQQETVNVTELLKPYRNLRPDDVDLNGGDR
jgi:hypothetical protein